MGIYIRTSTAGSYGGGLPGNLRYFGQFLEEELNKNNFETSFDEIDLTLAYPPLYILPGIRGMEKSFKKYYETLPLIRAERRYKRITAIIPAPAFSEYCGINSLQKDQALLEQVQTALSKKKQVFDKEKIIIFEIEDQYKNLSEEMLAQRLISEFINLGKMIESKLKKEDIFDIECYQKVLQKIKDTIDLALLEKITEKFRNLETQKTLDKAVDLRAQKKLARNKLIRDIRIYPHLSTNKALFPYDNQYAEIFLNLLRRANFQCPGYDHIYITVAPNKDEALRNSIPGESWHAYGIATLDYEKYKKMDIEEKKKAVFQTICSGLRDIAEVDGLDKDILEKVINQIRQKGLDTELIYYSGENDRYEVVITYFVGTMEEGLPIYFSIKDKILGKQMKKSLGKAKYSAELHYWLNKITLTKSMLKIESGKSFKASLWVKGKPKILKFKLDEKFV